MLPPQAVCNQIREMVSYLVKIGLSSDQNFSFIRKHSGDITEVTFNAADNVSVALKDRSYSDIYDHLESARAYIAKLPDGALLLMRYRYIDNKLTQHSLGFFPSPRLEEFQNNPDIYCEEAIYADVVAKNIVPFPLRFDFDCRDKVAKPVKHPKSHLTLGQYENCRIPVTSPLTPSHFILFILRHFYNTAFLEYCKEAPVFSDSFDETIHSLERAVIYLAIPPIV